jgi:hypothetical protein
VLCGFSVLACLRAGPASRLGFVGKPRPLNFSIWQPSDRLNLFFHQPDFPDAFSKPIL